MTYISTPSLTSPMRTSVLQTQAALTQAQNEVAAGGIVDDLGMTLGGNTGYELSLRSNIDALGTYSQTNAVATTRLSATANALTSMVSAAQTLSSSLVAAQSTGGSTAVLTTAAQGALSGLIGQLNTSAGGQYVFGGIATQTAPIADSTAPSTAVQSAFQQYLASNTPPLDASTLTGAQMNSFLGSTAFTSNFSGTAWSAASSQTMTTSIAPGQTTSTSVSANQGTFQTMAQAYTMIAEFTGSNMSADAKAAVVATASTLVNTGIAGLTEVQAGVGVAQSAISAANTQNTAQANVLTTSSDSLDSIDPAALSTRVTALQTQLENSYQLTSRLQSLSLVNYLTTTG